MTDSNERILADLIASRPVVVEMVQTALDRLVNWLHSGSHIGENAFFTNNDFALEDLHSVLVATSQLIGTALPNEISTLCKEAQRAPLEWDIPEDFLFNEQEVDWGDLDDDDIEDMDRATTIDHLKKAKREIAYLLYCYDYIRHRMNQRLQYRPMGPWDFSMEYSPPASRSVYHNIGVTGSGGA